MGMTRLQLRDAIRRKAETEGTGIPSDGTLNGEINDKIKIVHAMIFKKNKTRLIKTQAITMTGADSYSLPTDMMSPYLFHRDNVSGLIIQPISPQHADAFSNAVGAPVHYYMMGDQVFFSPKPSSGTVLMRYVPRAPTLSADSGINASLSLSYPDEADLWVIGACAAQVVQGIDPPLFERIHFELATIADMLDSSIGSYDPVAQSVISGPGTRRTGGYGYPGRGRFR